jgi:hypothetical protein
VIDCDDVQNFRHVNVGCCYTVQEVLTAYVCMVSVIGTRQ